MISVIINGSEIEVVDVTFKKSSLEEDFYNDCYVEFQNKEIIRYDACDVTVIEEQKEEDDDSENQCRYLDKTKSSWTNSGYSFNKGRKFRESWEVPYFYGYCQNKKSEHYNTRCFSTRFKPITDLCKTCIEKDCSDKNR